MTTRNLILSLATTLLLGFAVAPAGAANIVQVPDCRYAGQTVTADLSTTTAANWSVSGPGAAGPSSLSTPFAPWSALPSIWIQPQAVSGPANSNFAAGDYTYTIRFNLPCDPKNYQRLTVTGAIAADNSFKAYLNGSSTTFASCPGPNCFGGSGNPTPVTLTGTFVQGVNTITIVVHNNESYTGLAAQMKLTAMCGKECCRKLPPRDPRESEN